MSSSARNLFLVADRQPESDREISGVHSNAALVATAKIPKVQLDRLRQIRDERDAAIAATLDAPWNDETPTVQAHVVDLPANIPSPVEPEPISLDPDALEALVELPATTPELTVVMRYQPVTAPPFTPIVGAPVMVGPAAIEAARIAREAARQEQRTRNRTKWLVVAIWATAFALAGGLAWVVSHEHEHTTAPVVSE